MTEIIDIIDIIVDLLHKLKYGSILNKRRDYVEKINSYIEIIGNDADIYNTYVINQIKQLKVKPYCSGIPRFAIFEKCNGMTRIFVLNEKFQFMYRLSDYSLTSYSFYFKIDYWSPFSATTNTSV